MSERGLRVPRSRGEATRRSLADAGLLRTDREILEEEGCLVFPLVTEGVVPSGWGEVVERAFEPRPPAGPVDYRELIGGSREERDRLPRAFDVVGDIVLIRIPPDVTSRATEIGEALLRFVPGARIVGWDRGVQGSARRRQVQRIAGAGGWSTIHRENGLPIQVDVERAYFSPRLAREHARVAAEIRAADRVYDLCCGVGPFSLHVARDGRAREIVAVDSNPDAIELLRRSLVRLPGGDRVRAIEATIESFLPGRPPFEAVILNLPHEGIKYVTSVATAVAPGGRFFYYEIVPRSEFEGRAEAVVSRLSPTGRWHVADRHVVHPYSPDADLVSFTFARTGA